MVSATPSTDLLDLIDRGMSEFSNQKLCDSGRVMDLLLDIRNAATATDLSPEMIEEVTTGN